MLGVTLTLRGDRGALTLGAVDCVTFRDWTLTPQGGNVADLRVSGEAAHAYDGRKQPTALRIHFRAPAGSPSDQGPIRGSKASLRRGRATIIPGGRGEYSGRSGWGTITLRDYRRSADRAAESVREYRRRRSDGV